MKEEQDTARYICAWLTSHNIDVPPEIYKFTGTEKFIGAVIGIEEENMPHTPEQEKDCPTPSNPCFCDCHKEGDGTKGCLDCRSGRHKEGLHFGNLNDAHAECKQDKEAWREKNILVASTRKECAEIARSSVVKFVPETDVKELIDPAGVEGYNLACEKIARAIENKQQDI